jgi:hypothetical protein
MVAPQRESGASLTRLSILTARSVSFLAPRAGIRAGVLQSGVGLLGVTRYAEIKAIFADPKVYSASNAQTPIKPLSPQVVQIL